MAALGKLRGSISSLTQETALSLAHLNFDFSIVKVEAPLEYQAIRKNLSSTRVKAAEQGPEHVVARKLRGLFDGEIPDTPTLIKVYGRRATEIIESRDANPHGTRDDGVFQGWIGADATTLWAAATSGRSAMAVHLLACLLARMFSPPEATAIWEELVASRKLAISSPDEMDPLSLAKHAAASMEISRQQLANWDASARAWLTVADKANRVRQDQVKLIVQNVILPVNQKNAVLQSVMEAWRSALTNMENILNGVSCTVTDGAVLLALYSWHIYPDLHIVGRNVENVNQADGLVPEGVLVTLGASNASPDSASGVYWSLPLAHLRYYGDPVLVSGNLTHHTNRLSRSEFLMTTLGCVFSTWKVCTDDMDEAVELICKLSSYLFGDHHTLSHGGSHWLQHLSVAAREFLCAQGFERKHLRSLINRGRCCYGEFLGKKDLHPEAIFGLQDISKVLELVNMEEDKIAVLRLFAEGLNATPDSLLIRYKPRRELRTDAWGQQRSLASQTPSNNVEPSINLDDAWDQLIMDEPNLQESQWEYATAIPRTAISKKRKWSEINTLAGHTRWTEMGPLDLQRRSLSHQTEESFFPLSQVSLDYRPSTGFRWALESPLSPVTRNSNSKTQSTHFQPWAGDVRTAAIFKRADFPLQTSTTLSPSKLSRLLDKKLIDPNRLMFHLDSLGSWDQSPLPAYTQSLRALAAAMDAYLLMPGATISNAVFSKPLHTALWASLVNREGRQYTAQSLTDQEDNRIREVQPAEPVGPHQIQPITRSLNRMQLLACITMFENRDVDLDPVMLESVFAVASNNSIYIAAPLTCDPCDRPRANSFKHIIGNIGKSGITLMIPPTVPKIRRSDDHHWKYLDHNPAPEICEYGDSFANTSLHLSFTRYEVAADIRNHGFQGVEARFLETIVSIYDGDEWVADLDILKALCSERLYRVTTPLSKGSRRHRCQHMRYQSNHKVPKCMKLTLIDNWEELLVPSWTSRLFRAEGNKFARLGAAALGIQRGHQVVVFEDRKSICWQCVAAGMTSKISENTHAASTSTNEADIPTFIC